MKGNYVIESLAGDDSIISEVMTEPWKGYVEPFSIFGNLYFVGTEQASTHIVDTGDGYLLFDSGYQHTLYLVLFNMAKLGLDPRKIKYIIHTHGHIDHIGATRALVELTGAKTFLGRADEKYANGELDLTYARELGLNFVETFQPDVLLDDGDQIQLGNTTVTSLATPGHTPGAMSYCFDVTDGKETFRAGLHGGMGTNTMCSEYLDRYGLSYDCRDQFCHSMDRLAKIPVDLFLGNHMQHNHTAEKYQRLCAGDPHAFVVPGEWGDYCRWAKQHLLEKITPRDIKK